MPLKEQPRRSISAVLDHNENPRLLEQTESATISKSHSRGRGSPLRSIATGCHQPGQAGMDDRLVGNSLNTVLRAFCELVCCCSEQQPVSCHKEKLNSCPGQQKPFSSLKTDQAKGRFRKSFTVTNVCIVFNQNFSLKFFKKLCSDLYHGLCSWHCCQVRRSVDNY